MTRSSASASIPPAVIQTPPPSSKNNASTGFIWTIVSAPFNLLGYVLGGFMRITGLNRLFYGSV